MKYIKLKKSDVWSKIMSPVRCFKNSPHTATKMAPKKVNEI